jgi:hypothetical protein
MVCIQSNSVSSVTILCHEICQGLYGERSERIYGLVREDAYVGAQCGSAVSLLCTYIDHYVFGIQTPTLESL